MVLAVTKPKLVNFDGRRLKQRVSGLAILPGAVVAARRGEARKAEREAQKRAKLMSTAQCSIHVSESVPRGKFTVIDPDSPEAMELGECPFPVKTLIVHPDDIDQAQAHFEKAAPIQGRAN